jgi:hypothetical protein
LIKNASDATGRTSGEQPAAKPRHSPFGILIRAALAVALLGGGIAWYGHWASSASGWAVAHEGDHVSAAETQRRQLAFEALGQTALRPVDATQISAAIEDMGLTPEARRGLLDDLAYAAPHAGETSHSAALPQRVGEPRNPLRLAWVTLWDTDVEDGDVVRIDSEGYSRTVVLTKQGTNFAVPVPQNGVITITGIRDGDGGGVTVGLASGSTKAVLPIMSAGQTIRLAVTIP